MKRLWPALVCSGGLALILLGVAHAGDSNDEELGKYIKKGPLPPPRIGEQVTLPFPPPASGARRPPPPTVEATPLAITLHQPEGVEQTPPAISVSFNQPMVPVTSVAATSSNVPVRVEPPIDGTWKWLGTSTISLVPKARLRFATHYKVTVPSGTRSASGQPLAKAFTYGFDSPLPKVTQTQPYDGGSEVGLAAPIVVWFNQDVSADKISPFVELADKGGHAIPLVVVPRAQWAADKQLASFASSANSSFMVALRPTRPLEPNTTYQITVRAGLVSDEGPLPMQKAHVAHFATYPPMMVRNVDCGSCNSYQRQSESSCDVGQNLCVSFNHSVVVKRPEEFISVTPRPADLKLRADGNSVHLDGSFHAGTHYEVRVAPGIKDSYDQALAKPFSSKVEFTHLPTELEPLVDRTALIEKNGALALPLRVVNVDSITVEAYRIPDEKLAAVESLIQYSIDDSTFKSGLDSLQPQRVARWQDHPHAPKDHESVHPLSLRALVEQHGPGPYLIVLEHAQRALLLQLTDLGLTTRYDSQQMVVLATSIATGKPLAGVRLRVVEPEGVAASTGTTDQNGVAVLRAAKRTKERSQNDLLVLASHGSDRAFLHAHSYGDDGRGMSLNWGWPERAAGQRTFFYTDRDLYRPGETIEVYAIRRQVRGDDRIGLMPNPAPLAWTARSSRQRELGSGSAPSSPFGTHHFSVKIPEQVDLGSVHIETKEGSIYASVQEYRAPEFEVAVKIPPKPVFFADRLEATVTGRYLFGAPMRKARLQWSLFGEATRFAPADHSDFHFGSAIEPWHERHWEYRGRSGPSRMAGGTAKLDGEGRYRLATDLNDVGEQLDPTTLTLEAQVTDVSRQVVAGRDTVVAHPGDRYLGVRLPPSVIEEGKVAQIDLALLDLAGKRVAGVPLTVKATKQTYEPGAATDDEGNAGTRYEPKIVEAAPCTVVSDAAVRGCALRFPKSGTYLLEARGIDSKQRPVITRTYVYVVGKDKTAKDTKAGRVELRFDRKSYQPGDTAVVSLRAPFADGVALFTTERLGLVSHQIVKIAGYVGTAKVPVREEQIPNLEVSATVIAARKDRGPAAWATGSASLEIARDRKKLLVTVVPQRTIARPGEQITVEVLVTDTQQRPVSARVSLVGVDEAVLSMTGFLLPDPLPIFHHVRESGVALAELLKLLLPEERRPGAGPAANKERAAKMAPSEDMAGEASIGGGAGGLAGGGGGPTATRRLFLTTPLADVLTTDARGKVRFTLPLPDNLTRFRLMAVAADAGDRFGGGQSNVTVQRPLQLRASLPRFINTSDTFQAGVIVDNQTAQSGEAEVTLDTSGVELVGAHSTKVVVGAGEAKEVTFEVRAPRPGTGKFRFGVTLGQDSDAVERTLPIWTPATSEAFATYGTTTGNVTQPVAMPKDVMPGYGGLSITIAATALTGLQDAAHYLIEYPYGCAEQVSSKAMPILVLGDIVAQFGLGGPDVLALQKKHAAVAIGKLISGQRSDGSWGTWGSPSDEGRADLTAYILIVLRRGKEAGLAIPAQTITSATAYLTQWIASHDKPEQGKPEWTRKWAWDISAMALYALSDWEQRDEALARRLYTHAAELDTFAKAFLAAVFHRISPSSAERAALLRELMNRVIQTPAAARFQEQQSEALQLLMHSSSRTDAIALLVLTELEPKSELGPKIARGLMDARINGRWDTTQANAFALYALSRYWKVYEAEPTAFVAAMWLGKGYLGESKFEARSMREEHLEVPMKVVQATGAADVTIGKTGTGRVYYRIGMRYAPRELMLPAAEQGVTVSRSYEAVERPDDVVHEKDGSWSVKAGATVRVRLQLVVQDRRHYLVVDDALPAGLELINSEYKTSGEHSRNEEVDGEYFYWRFNHRELRDERSLHFADELEPGQYTLTVLARATSRGRFIVPPTRSEEMYRPEVFGRSASDRMTIR